MPPLPNRKPANPPIAKAKEIKQQRKGVPCYLRNVTLTTRAPWSLRQGFGILAHMLVRQPDTVVDYVFYPEYTSNGHLHFHGTVYFTNMMHFHSMINYWQRMYGFTDVKPTLNTDPKKSLTWHFYCRKDQYQLSGDKVMRIHRYNVKYVSHYYRDCKVRL